MELNQIIGLIAIAVFALPTAYLLGYARREKQQEGWASDSRKAFKAERDAARERHYAELTQERNVICELEISLLKAGEAVELERQALDRMTKRWDYADNYRAAIVEVIYGLGLWNFKEHVDDPRLMLQVLVDHAAKEAIDPQVNQKAKNLITRGVRKGAKQGREQMRKLMQKSIDNQAATIRNYDVELTNANVRRMRFTEAVTNVLNDKIALPGVRRALGQAIIQEHDRLRAVAKQKGE